LRKSTDPFKLKTTRDMIQSVGRMRKQDCIRYIGNHGRRKGGQRGPRTPGIWNY